MKTMSTHAETAKSIRVELKKAFPLITFRVTARCFAGGNSVDVSWKNGPTTKQVERIIGKYEYGHFDGMRDLYEYTNVRKDIPQVKYVQISREITKEIMDQAFQDGVTYFASWEVLKDRNDCFRDRMGYLIYPDDEIHRLLSKHDLSDGYNKEMLI